jgi:hypothetical protein
MWHQRKQGYFAFMEQDTKDNVPYLPDDKVTEDLTLDWVEENTLLDPKEKMKDTHGCLRKGRENNVRYPVVSFVSTLPLIFWKISFGESNRFAHQEMRNANTKCLTENNMCGAQHHIRGVHGVLCVPFRQQNTTTVFSTNQKCTPLQ